MRSMRKCFLVLSLCCMIMAAGARFSAAEESEGLLSKCDIEASGGIDFYSRYVWRGFTLDRDPVIQPSLSLSSKGFTFTFWSSWDADNNDAAASDEMDFVLDYTKSFGDMSVSLGHTYYDFPGTNGYSREFYIGAGLSEIPWLDLPIALSLTFYRDYGDQNHGGGLGNYLELAFSYSKTIVKDPEVVLELGAVVGYNHGLFIAGDGGQTTLSAGLSIPLTKNLTMSPNVNYVMPFGDLSDSGDGNQNNIFWGGVSLGFAF